MTCRAGLSSCRRGARRARSKGACSISPVKRPCCCPRCGPSAIRTKTCSTVMRPSKKALTFFSLRENLALTEANGFVPGAVLPETTIKRISPCTETRRREVLVQWKESVSLSDCPNQSQSWLLDTLKIVNYARVQIRHTIFVKTFLTTTELHVTSDMSKDHSVTTLLHGSSRS